MIEDPCSADTAAICADSATEYDPFCTLARARLGVSLEAAAHVEKGSEVSGTTLETPSQASYYDTLSDYPGVTTYDQLFDSKLLGPYVGTTYGVVFSGSGCDGMRPPASNESPRGHWGRSICIGANCTLSLRIWPRKLVRVSTRDPIIVCARTRYTGKDGSTAVHIRTAMLYPVSGYVHRSFSPGAQEVRRQLGSEMRTGVQIIGLTTLSRHRRLSMEAVAFAQRANVYLVRPICENEATLNLYDICTPVGPNPFRCTLTPKQAKVAIDDEAKRLAGVQGKTAPSCREGGKKSNPKKRSGRDQLEALLGNVRDLSNSSPQRGERGGRTEQPNLSGATSMGVAAYAVAQAAEAKMIYGSKGDMSIWDAMAAWEVPGFASVNERQRVERVRQSHETIFHVAGWLMSTPLPILPTKMEELIVNSIHVNRSTKGSHMQLKASAEEHPSISLRREAVLGQRLLNAYGMKLAEDDGRSPPSRYGSSEGQPRPNHEGLSEAAADVLALCHMPTIIAARAMPLLRSGLPSAMTDDRGVPYLVTVAVRLAMEPLHFDMHDFDLKYTERAGGAGMAHLRCLFYERYDPDKEDSMTTSDDNPEQFMKEGAFIDGSIYRAIRAATMILGRIDPGPLEEMTFGVPTWSTRWHPDVLTRVRQLIRGGRRLVECIFGRIDSSYGTHRERAQKQLDQLYAGSSIFNDLMGDFRTSAMNGNTVFASSPSSSSSTTSTFFDDAHRPPWPLSSVPRAEAQKALLDLLRSAECRLRSLLEVTRHRAKTEAATSNAANSTAAHTTTDTVTESAKMSRLSIAAKQMAELSGEKDTFLCNLARYQRLGTLAAKYKAGDSLECARAENPNPREHMEDVLAEKLNFGIRFNGKWVEKDPGVANNAHYAFHPPACTDAMSNNLSGEQLLTQFLAYGPDGVDRACGITSHIVSPDVAVKCCSCSTPVVALEGVIGKPFGQCRECDAWYCHSCSKKHIDHQVCQPCAKVIVAMTGGLGKSSSVSGAQWRLSCSS